MKSKTKNIIFTALFTALTAIGAFISIPAGPVPITLQSMFTMLSGVLLGSSLGSLSQLVYVLLGLFGIPVFAGGSGGLSCIVSPSFGYLIGFIIAPLIIGRLVSLKKNHSFLSIFLCMIAGEIAIYLIGIPYMYIILKFVMNTKITLMGAVKTGFIIFIPGDLIKILIASLLGSKLFTFRIQ